jgi:hypothetical protein
MQNANSYASFSIFHNTVLLENICLWRAEWLHMSWSVKFNTGNLQVMNERRWSSTVVSYEYCHKNIQLSVYETAIFEHNSQNFACTIYIVLFCSFWLRPMLVPLHSHLFNDLYIYIYNFRLLLLKCILSSI